MKASKKAFVHHESLAYFPAFSNKTKKKKKKRSPFLSTWASSLGESHPFYSHCVCLWWAKSLLFRCPLSRLAVAINDYLPCLGGEMSLINYTCKPGLILTEFSTERYRRHSKSASHSRVAQHRSLSHFLGGCERRRRQAREKYNAHLSSLKLRLDEGRVVLVIIRGERRKEGEEGNEDSRLVMQSNRLALKLHFSSWQLQKCFEKRIRHGNSNVLYQVSSLFKKDKRRHSLSSTTDRGFYF